MSVSSIRLGRQRLFRCPRCRDLVRFNISQIGTDPSLPTHGDNAETGVGGRVFALMLGPTLAFIASGFLLRFVLGFRNPLFLTVPPIIGVVWVLAYGGYLYVKSGRDIESPAEGLNQPIPQ